MRHSWIKRVFKYAGKNYLITLLTILLTEKNNKPKSRPEKQVEPQKFHLKKHELLLILGVSIILILTVYITFRTGALESTRYYQI